MGIMFGKTCYIVLICAVVVFGGGCCQIGGRAYDEDLGNGYAVWAADTMQDAIIVRKGKGGSTSARVVQPTVFAYGWNDNFIIAKQHPRKDRKVDTSLTYWYIVEVASGKVHGPLSKDEFNKLRTKLKAPAEISFKTVRLNADWK